MDVERAGEQVVEANGAAVEVVDVGVATEMSWSRLTIQSEAGACLTGGCLPDADGGVGTWARARGTCSF